MIKHRLLNNWNSYGKQDNLTAMPQNIAGLTSKTSRNSFRLCCFWRGHPIIQALLDK